MDLEFSTVEELYQRVELALKAKQAELHRLGYRYIELIDLWKYLIESKWKKAHNLALSDIVHDILHIDPKQVDLYLKGNVKSRRSQEDLII